jgi:PKD repeat protein
VATPEVFTFEIELSSDSASGSPRIRSFDAEAAYTGNGIASPIIRGFEAEAASTTGQPTTTAQLRTFEIEGFQDEPQVVTPELKTFEIEGLQNQVFSITAEINTFEAEAASPGNGIASPVARTFEVDAAPTTGQPLATAHLRTFEAEMNLEFSPPEVTLDAPTVGPLEGVISLEATASDPNLEGITQVEFLVDGIVVNTDTSAPYQYNYDTSVLSNGTHNFQARALNVAGLTATTPPLNLLIDNSGPEISLISPITGPLAGSFAIEALASDLESGISIVEFLVDGIVVGSDSSSPYSFVYDSSVLPDGTHDFSARATNGTGLQTETIPLPILIDNSPPIISEILSPSDGATISGGVSIDVDAYDLESGILRVDFLLDGNVIGSDFVPNSPYSFILDTSLLSNGFYEISATAINGAGLSSTTSTITVTVINSAAPLPLNALTCEDMRLPYGGTEVDAEYPYTVLSNFMSLFPDKDRSFISRYWGGLQQLAEDFHLQLYQNDFSKNINDVPVYRRSRWNEIILFADAKPAELFSPLSQSSYDTSIATGDNEVGFVIDGNTINIVLPDSPTTTLLEIVSSINASAALAFNRVGLQIAFIDEDLGLLKITSLDIGESASVSVSDDNPNTILGFFPGASAQGSGVATRAEPAQIVGTKNNPIIDTVVENKLQVVVDGTLHTILFQADPSTLMVSAVDTINSVVPNLASLDPDGKVVLTSPTTGPTSSLLIPIGGGNQEIGFAEGKLSIGCGDKISTPPIPAYPVSYEVRIGESGDDLKLQVSTDSDIMSIPALRNRIDAPILVLGQANKPHTGEEGEEEDFGAGISEDAEVVDCNDASAWVADKPSLVRCSYLISNGRIHFNKNVEAEVRRLCLEKMWAEDVYREDEYLRKNFGFPIQYERDNSLEYKNVLQGLHYAYWNGPIERRVEVGLTLLFGLPTAPVDGVINSIIQNESPTLRGLEVSDFFDVRGANRTFSFTIDGTFAFAIFDPGNLYPEDGPAPSHENYPSANIINDINNAALAFGLGFQPASGFIPDPGQPDQVQIQLTAVDSIRIDTVTGNAAIGFPAGKTAFGQKTIVIGGESFVVSTEFPITRQVGDVLQKLDPLTDGVEILHYITDPIWWEVFGLSSLTPKFTLAKGYSEDDIKIINEILKYHLFGVKIVPDAFTKLGNIELSIVAKFLNDIRAIFTNYIILIPFKLLDVFGLTDDADLDGRPDDIETLYLQFPPNMEAPPWNMIDTAANEPPPHNLSFSTSNPAPDSTPITKENVVNGEYVNTHGGYIDWLSLDAYDIELVNGGDIQVVGGGYQAASHTGSAAGPFDTLTPASPLTMLVNGVSAIITYGENPGEIPQGDSVSAHDVANVISDTLQAALSSGPGSAQVSVTLDQKIVIKVDRTDGLAPPTLEITSTNTDIGITPTGTIVGSSGTLIAEINF